MAEQDPTLTSEPFDPSEEVVIVETVQAFIPPNRPRKVYSGMWGPPEIGAVAVSIMALLMAAVAYFLWVVPSNNELVKNRAEADRLEAELISARTKYGEITDTETQVGRIVASIDDFEARFLPVSTSGQAALYQRLNGLLAAYDLVNTSGPDYAPLETLDMNVGTQNQEEKGRSKYRSLYPGIYVSTTVEGSYQNLRRFIREIETGRDFVIVSAVQLAPSDSNNGREKKESGNSTGGDQPVVRQEPFNRGFQQDPRNFQGGFSQPQFPQPEPEVQARPKGKTHGEVVSLIIELAAYFRRPAAPAAPVE